MPARAHLETAGDRPVLRLARRLRHRPERVWSAVTDPAELAHWFPAVLSGELKPGATLEFAFDGPMESGAGEVLVFDPPRVFEFSWNADVLRIELTPDGEDGCLLEFTHTFNRGEPAIARLGAGRTAAGWDTCLDALGARLDGREPTPPSGWHERMSAYVGEFGLGEGEVLDEGTRIRFRRDLVWKPLADVWPLLPGPGDGEVTGSVAPSRLEHTWRHHGNPAGNVRWELRLDPLDGVRVEFTQTVPAELSALLPELLAARHEQLDALFARTFDLDPEPWPAERAEAVRKRYAEQVRASRITDALAHQPERNVSHPRR
ncbi:SRPBCC family protein [Amycolatopsis sp. PS_44_ISF1]|uniref:SRPBCC family protein n=1 Tax=Amycolatopsis sp. PS_44_ISF1 TaxID=2974917 RepID=UPI0028DDCEFE|nr:SRPBCC family protein [Amycolatopsis sp. PS_44_ISF1]MDT8909506.1 SRPBCC family protein [Amycolatopsis sp. PS_44_ISF1]